MGTMIITDLNGHSVPDLIAYWQAQGYEVRFETGAPRNVAISGQSSALSGRQLAVGSSQQSTVDSREAGNCGLLTVNCRLPKRWK